jgi:hypothetical protein
MIYESMKDGGTPFRISIQEYRSLKKEVKETFAEQIAAIDRQPKEKVADAVVRLKEQLIGAGMSAEEATKKIYTMLQLSNKKDQSISATIGNNKFSSITDPQSAAVSSVNSFGEATRNEGNVEKALAFNNALAATETGINDIIAKRERLVAKDLSGKTKSLSYSEAEKIMIDQLNASKEAGTIITEATVDEMAKTNPNIKKVINGSDTIVSVWQKIRLQAQGFSGDLSKLSAEQAGVIANVFNAIAASVESTNRTGILKEQYANLDKLKGQISDYTKALKGQTVTEQISDRKRLSAINKQIEAINKLAEARKKALAAAQEDANLGRQIEKVRLEIQNAESVGDTEKAQSLRIDLESLTSQQQTDAQMNAIDAAAEKATKPLKAAAEAISNNQQELADSAALAGESLDKLQKKYDKQKTAIDLVNNAMTALYGNADAAGQSVQDYVKSNKTAAAGFVAAMEAATNAAMPKYKEVTTTELTANGPVTTTTKVPISPEQNALALLLKAGTTGKVDMAIANSIKGGASLFDVVKAIKTYIPSKKDGNETFGNDPLTGTGKNAYDAYKNVVSQGQSQKLITATGAVFEVFRWNKKSYVADATSGVIYPYDEVNKTVGKKAVSRHDGGKISGPGTATSDSIPAWLSNGEYVFSAKAVDAAGGPDAVDSLHQALRKADGGPIGKQKPQKQQLPFFPWRPDLPNYWSNGKPTGDPRTGRWGELRYSPSKGHDIWGGTEIPGLKFTGKTPQQSDYWHQMTEQPSKSRGPGMGIDKDPMRLAGSGASMGFSGNGAYGFGPLLFAMGGLVQGYKTGGSVIDKLKNLFKLGGKGGLKGFGIGVRSGAAYQGMEEAEKLLSLKYGASEHASGIEKWGKAFARFGFSALQGGAAGAASLGGLGFVGGSVAGTAEGLIGLIKGGSQFGVKGGTAYSYDNLGKRKDLQSSKYFNSDGGAYIDEIAKKDLSSMSLSESAKKIAATAGLSGILPGASGLFRSAANSQAISRQGVRVFDRRMPKFINDLMETGFLNPSKHLKVVNNTLTEYQNKAKGTMSEILDGKGSVNLFGTRGFAAKNVDGILNKIKAFMHPSDPGINFSAYVKARDNNVVMPISRKTPSIQEVLAMPVKTLRQQMQRSKLLTQITQGVSHSGSPDTLFHELGHRNLNILGGPQALVERTVAPFSKGWHGLHEGFADIFQDDAHRLLKGSSNATLSDRLGEGSTYATNPGRSILEDTLHRLEGASRGRLHQMGTEFLVPYTNMIKGRISIDTLRRLQDMSVIEGPIQTKQAVRELIDMLTNNIPKFKNGVNVVPEDMLAMVHKSESIIPAAMNPFNPEATMPKYNFGRSSFSVNGVGESGASYTVNQNIYASEGMDIEALSNIIVRKAEAVIGQKAKVNVKMVGQGKNI